MSRPIESAPRASIAPVERDLHEAPVDGPADERATPIRAERVSKRFVELIPRDFARQHLILSQGSNNGVERLAVAETSDPAAVFNVGVRLGASIETQLANGESIAQLIDEVYQRHAEAEDHAGHDTSDELPSGGISGGGGGGGEMGRLLAEADRDLLSTQGKGPIVKLVDALLFEALSRRASDVHVQPLDDRTLVRYRLDGVLHTARELPRTITASVVSRIKVMGRMDIAERRIPQDGRATVTIGTRPVDLRISTLPTSYGERAVLRLLDNSQQLCDLDQIGMPVPGENSVLPIVQ